MVSSADIVGALMPASKLYRESSNFVGNKNVQQEVSGELFKAFLLSFILIVLFQILPVMLIAVNCNPKSPVTYGIIAFLFPGVYLFQHSVRKYMMREKGYCGN